MRKPTFALALGLVLVAAAVAQTPQRLLSDGDVKKFIRDFKPMTDELDQLGVSADVDEEKPGSVRESLAALRANADAQKVFRKYGWGDRQFDKFAAILLGYMVVMLEQARTDQGGELKEAVAMIESNPGLSAEQKAAMKAQMAAMDETLLEGEKDFRAQVHAADIDAVRANLAALDAVFNAE